MKATWNDHREERPSEMGSGGPGYYGGGGQQLGGEAPRHDRAPHLPRKSPGLAVFLSILFPGLGQIYIGYYQRGFTHALIAIALISGLTSIGEHAGGLAALLGVSLGFFWLYNFIDAGRRASLYNMALESGRTPEMPEEPKLRSGGSIAGGVILIAIGLLVFLNTMFDISLDWLADWWPLGLIGLGVWMVIGARKARQPKP